MYILIFWLLLMAFVVSCLTAFVIMLFYKIGVVEWLQVHGNKFISSMAHCDYCMSWWMSCIFTVVVFIVTCDDIFLTVPFLSTPIARKLL